MATDKKRRLTRSNIGYVGPDGVKPYSWNVGGFGCSNIADCPGCYAKAMCRRSRCPDCAAFKVHSHPERLCEPANTRKPGVVLVDFLSDWCDPNRPDEDWFAVMLAYATAQDRGHVYVTLTKQVSRLKALLGSIPGMTDDDMFHGLTIRHQQDADAKLPVFLSIPGKLWISYEPAWGPVNFQYIRTGPDQPMHGHPDVTWHPCGNALRKPKSPEPGAEVIVPARWHGIEGMIIGHDNRRGAPGTDTLDHIRDAVRQCKAAGVKVYCKQIWHKGKLLRANHPEEYAQYPHDLKWRQLPWSDHE